MTEREEWPTSVMCRNWERLRTLLGGPGPGDLIGLSGENIVCTSQSDATHGAAGPS